jgi:hypothetical protein
MAVSMERPGFAVVSGSGEISCFGEISACLGDSCTECALACLETGSSGTSTLCSVAMTASSMMSSSSFFGSTLGTTTFSFWAAGFFIWLAAGFAMTECLAGAGAGSAGAGAGGVGDTERAGVGDIERAGEVVERRAGAVGEREVGEAAGGALRERLGLLLGAATVEMGAAAAGAALGMVGLVCCLSGETFLFFPSSAAATAASL